MFTNPFSELSGLISPLAMQLYVIAMILLFANPFWNYVVAQAATIAQVGG